MGSVILTTDLTRTSHRDKYSASLIIECFSDGSAVIHKNRMNGMTGKRSANFDLNPLIKAALFDLPV